MRRTFTSFPSGWAGAALLVLRGVVGISATAEAAFAAAFNHSAANLAMAIAAALAGLALLTGFMTSSVSALLAASGAAILVWMPAGLEVLASRMALFEFVVMAATLVVLGPGAASIDARLYGRREVSISDEHRPDDL